VGANRESGLALAAPDRLYSELDRGSPGRTGGGQRDGRAFGSEMIRQMLADDAVFEGLIDRCKLGVARHPPEISIARIAIRRRFLRNLKGIWPCDFKGRQCKKQRPWKLPLRTDAGLRDRLLARQ